MNLSQLKISVVEQEEDLINATRHDGRSHLQVYRSNRIMAVLGRGSNPERELNLASCIEDQLPIFRRKGGGCAVVLDPGNVIVSLAEPVEEFGKIPGHFARLSAWLMAGLRNIGIQKVYREGDSDLAIDNLKVGGACLYRTKGLQLYSATLLVSPRVDLIERYLAHPPREPAYRQHRTHREFIGAIGTSGTPSINGWADALAGALRLPDPASNAAAISGSIQSHH